MKWNEVPNKAIEAYLRASDWCFTHQVETDAIVVGVVIWSLLLLRKEQNRRRRRIHRFLWGTLMSQQDRDKFQMMRFEDALTDAGMEMIFRGEMTDAEERKWYRYFADKLKFRGLIPEKNVKIGCLVRLKKRLGLKPVTWPGDKPGVKVDPTYNPHQPEAEGLSKSKYLNGG